MRTRRSYTRFAAIGPIFIDNQLAPERLEATTPGDRCVQAETSLAVE